VSLGKLIKIMLADSCKSPFAAMPANTFATIKTPAYHGKDPLPRKVYSPRRYCFLYPAGIALPGNLVWNLFFNA
jgi:hypothetical protein